MEWFEIETTPEMDVLENLETLATVSHHFALVAFEEGNSIAADVYLRAAELYNMERLHWGKDKKLFQ